MPFARVPDRLKQLLTLGEPRSDETVRDCEECWLDYSTIGLSASDAPGLIALATDKELNRANPPECYAPVHAWRALAQMKCEAAIVPLVGLIEELAEADDDWGLQDLPNVLATFGAAAIPEVGRALANQAGNVWARLAAGRAMTQIAKRCQSSRDSIVDILTSQLSQVRLQDPGFNGLIVAMLIELKATESVPAIRRAYGAGAVDVKACGSLDEVLAALGVQGGKHPT
jgi:hypothetical protein